MERVKREAEASLQIAQGLAARLSTSIDRLEDHCRQVVNKNLRTRLIQEINEITSTVIGQVHEKMRELQSYPALHLGEVIWIQAILAKNNMGDTFDFSPVLVQSQSASVVAQEMEAKYSDAPARIRYASVEEFERRTKSLTCLIYEGRIDNVLGLKAKEILWEVFGRNGRLVSILDREDT